MGPAAAQSHWRSSAGPPGRQGSANSREGKDGRADERFLGLTHPGYEEWRPLRGLPNKRRTGPRMHKRPKPGVARLHSVFDG